MAGCGLVTMGCFTFAVRAARHPKESAHRQATGGWMATMDGDDEGAGSRRPIWEGERTSAPADERKPIDCHSALQGCYQRTFSVSNEPPHGARGDGLSLSAERLTQSEDRVDADKAGSRKGQEWVAADNPRLTDVSGAQMRAPLCSPKGDRTQFESTRQGGHTISGDRGLYDRSSGDCQRKNLWLTD